ncbi:phage terminase large subunit [Amedibacillus sp. YH-ame6]
MNIPAPFNEKQINYLFHTFDSWFNVLEGGKRGSKNVLNTYAFCVNLETHPDRFHLIAGVDQSSPRVNIGDCDGYGLFNYFEGRYRKGKYEAKDCYYVQTKAGEKIIFFAGGKKKGSEADIRGYTYGSVYITEANLCCKEFLQEAMDRTLSSSRRKVFHDLNPKDKDHWYYVDFLQFHEDSQKTNKSYGYNYGHTSIADNMSLSDEKIKKELSTYKKDSVWYKRDILGHRETAEGLIFPYYADDEETYLADEEELLKLKGRFSHLIMGIDFGDSGSKYSFHLSGFIDSWKKMKALDETDMKKSNGIDAKMLCETFIKFYKLVIEKWGQPEWIFCDSASNTLINTLRTAAREAGLPYNCIAGVVKNPISDRPKTVDELLSSGRLEINRKCKNARKALKSLVWDEKKKDEPEDENKGNINDDWDSFCYTFITHTQYIELRR